MDKLIKKVKKDTMTAKQHLARHDVKGAEKSLKKAGKDEKVLMHADKKFDRQIREAKKAKARARG